MKSLQAFFDPYTQRSYTPGEEIDTPYGGEHADWLVRNGLAVEDRQAPKAKPKAG